MTCHVQSLKKDFYLGTPSSFYSVFTQQHFKCLLIPRCEEFYKITLWFNTLLFGIITSMANLFYWWGSYHVFNGMIEIKVIVLDTLRFYNI